jgi:hypothetical protein
MRLIAASALQHWFILCQSLRRFVQEKRWSNKHRIKIETTALMNNYLSIPVLNKKIICTPVNIVNCNPIRDVFEPAADMDFLRTFPSSVAEPHNFYAAPAPGRNFGAVPAAPAPASASTLLFSKAKFLNGT